MTSNKYLPLVSVVIVTRNRRVDVLECIGSLIASKTSYSNIEITLVDNGSNDGTIEAVSRRFSDVKTIYSKVNLGLTGGRNLGQKAAKGKYILFIDSDTVIDRNMIMELVKVIENDEKIGLVAPKIYSYLEPKIIWYAGATFNLITSQAHNVGAWTVDESQYNKIIEVSHAPTAFLVRKTAADELGGHDDVFVMSYGDADFGIRLRKKGYRVLYVPKAEMYHKLNLKKNVKSLRSLGFNTSLRPYYFARNKVIFMHRHAVNFPLFMLAFYPLFTLYYSIRIIQYHGCFEYLRPHFAGSLEGLLYFIRTLTNPRSSSSNSRFRQGE